MISHVNYTKVRLPGMVAIITFSSLVVAAVGMMRIDQQREKNTK